MHQPVMLEETISMLKPHPRGRYLDGTIGLGGHSFALLQAAGNDAELCGLDQDKKALAIAEMTLKPFGEKVHLVHAKYSSFPLVLKSLGWDYLDGALIDIGISSLQLDTAERGFSFLHDGLLDMRMDQDSNTNNLLEIINKSQQEYLKDIISLYGEEPQANRIAKAIIQARVVKPITTTKELAGLIEQAYPVSWRAKSRRHPATKTFQALRIVVNNELNELEEFLHTILSWLVPGGRVAVISFHSLEDRLVKRCMKSWTKNCICPPYFPVCKCYHKPEAILITKKPVCPSKKELLENARSRSAKLRVAEKCCFEELNKFSVSGSYDAKKSKKFNSKEE